MQHIISCIALLVLTACVLYPGSSEYLAQRHMQHMAQIQNVCLAAGTHRDTPEYNACILRLATAGASSATSDNNARISAFTETRRADHASRARYDANVRLCLSGTMSPLCHHERLNYDDFINVLDAEYKTNLDACLVSEPFCKRYLLTTSDAHNVEVHMQQKPLPPQKLWDAHPTQYFPALSTYGCGENGSCYGDRSALTGLPKTTYVQGYLRKDGTYVRSHYRSRR